MAEDVNKRILDKIDDSEFGQEIKDFLKKILIMELKNIEEGRWTYRDIYDKEIVRFAKKLK